MSNHRYNHGDPNQYLGGHSPHHGQQHGLHMPHSHLSNSSSSSNGHAHPGQGYTPVSAGNMTFMDSVMDNVHRRASYNPTSISAHATAAPHAPMPYASYPMHHPMTTHGGHPHDLIHHASSSSLSTLSPSLSTAVRPSPQSMKKMKEIVVHDHDVLSGRYKT